MAASDRSAGERPYRETLPIRQWQAQTLSCTASPQEPAATFGLIDPYVQQCGGSDVVVSCVGFVNKSQVPCQHMAFPRQFPQLSGETDSSSLSSIRRSRGISAIERMALPPLWRTR